MFHEDEPLRGKYLAAFNRQLLDEIEAARRRLAPEADYESQRPVEPDSSTLINYVPTTNRIPEAASGR